MSSESLSSVIIDLLDNHHKVGRAVVGLYRRGGTKLLDRSLPASLGNGGRSCLDHLEVFILHPLVALGMSLRLRSRRALRLEVRLKCS